MSCQCGYDNTPLAGDDWPTKCEGCGKPLRPDPDDPLHSDKPFPPSQIYEDDKPFVLDEDDRDRDDVDDDLLIVHEQRYGWSSGVGAAPYGYHVRKRVTTRVADEPCEQCGCERNLVDFSQHRAGVAHIRTIDCESCGQRKLETRSV